MTVARRILLLVPALLLAVPAMAGDAVTFTPIKFEALKAQLAANPGKAKFTIIDAWASNCAPCKENFPHLVEMHKKYGPKGLAVISLSLDDIEDKVALKSAEDFLKDKKATFANYYINEEFGAGFEHLDISAIPAVFLFGPDGKEIRRFTMDDPDNQFTYEQVEQAVEALLGGKPLPTK
jgi:thiol-disulfide isomerase/thioredoxin